MINNKRISSTYGVEKTICHLTVFVLLFISLGFFFFQQLERLVVLLGNCINKLTQLISINSMSLTKHMSPHVTSVKKKIRIDIEKHSNSNAQTCIL